MFEAASESERRMLSLEGLSSKTKISEEEPVVEKDVPPRELSAEELRAASPATWKCIWPGGDD